MAVSGVLFSQGVLVVGDLGDLLDLACPFLVLGFIMLVFGLNHDLPMVSFLFLLSASEFLALLYSFFLPSLWSLNLLLYICNPG